ncbi:MAG: DUF11 domain-containing protein, partial [Candidatus Falkowbacteria bacterium]|nr:DUF11 domain-containing protein [Candidatus Falkowbacteria bacterium]
FKKYSEEIVYTTGTGQCVGGSTVVKGEEGKPSLKIAKSVNIDFANPGQEGIEYLIIVSNAGNLVAYNVKLVDTLPTGLSYADGSPSKRNWDLGDIKPGESKSITYQVNVSQNARAMFYENVAEATAANQDQPVKSTVKLDVRTIRVLAATGFSLVEFIIMISALIILVGLSIFLRKKMA